MKFAPTFSLNYAKIFKLLYEDLFKELVLWSRGTVDGSHSGFRVRSPCETKTFLPYPGWMYVVG